MNPIKITQVNLTSLSLPENLRGKWYASRLGTELGSYDYQDDDLYADLIEQGDPDALSNSITTVTEPMHEYLHADGSWKNYAHYFSTKEEIESLII